MKPLSPEIICRACSQSAILGGKRVCLKSGQQANLHVLVVWCPLGRFGATRDAETLDTALVPSGRSPCTTCGKTAKADARSSVGVGVGML